jgi:hypothetical protein
VNSGTDGRIIDSGTTPRFVLLVVLVLITSGIMMMESAFVLFTANDAICYFAAGVDPYRAPSIDLGIQTVTQFGPWLACIDRYAPLPPWWLPAFWPVVVAVLGLLLFAVLPRWRVRRRRLVDAGEFDRSGDLHGELLGYAEGKELPSSLRFKVDLAKESDGAVAFGSNRNPVVCLDVNLVLQRAVNPRRFRTVVLHELAHVRNGDVTLTYVAVCVWRVFLWVVLPPYLVITGLSIAHLAGSPEFPVASRPGFRELLLVAALGVLIYLVRADVLRSRELYADRTARDWGASWPEEGGPTRRVFASVAELWRTHPNRSLRRDALRDPAPLFELPALPLFLTGAAATLVVSDFGAGLVNYRIVIPTGGVLGQVTYQVAVLITAAVVAGVAGTSIWRAVARATEMSKPEPPGALAGLWLGIGMATGELVASQVSVFKLLPAQPEVLLLVVLAGVAFGWWIAQCARLWACAWPGRSLRPAMLISLTGGALGESGDYSTRYVASVAIIVVVSSALAAAAASVLQGRAQLITGLIAAELTAFFGFAGACVIIARYGCVEPARGYATCSGHAASPWLSFHSLLVYLLEPILAVTVVVAFVVTAVAAVWRGSRDAVPGAVVRPAVTAGLCVLVLAVICWAAAVQTSLWVKPTSYVLLQQAAQRLLVAPDPDVSAQTLGEEVDAWGNIGGDWLLNHIYSDWSQYAAVRREQAAHPSRQTWPGVRHWVYPSCAGLSQIARIAYNYFRVPDPVAQESWYRVMSLAWAGGQDCEYGIDHYDSKVFVTGLRLLDEVGVNYQQTLVRVDAVEKAGGY